MIDYIYPILETGEDANFSETLGICFFISSTVCRINQRTALSGNFWMFYVLSIQRVTKKTYDWLVVLASGNITANHGALA